MVPRPPRTRTRRLVVTALKTRIVLLIREASGEQEDSTQPRLRSPRHQRHEPPPRWVTTTKPDAQRLRLARPDESLATAIVIDGATRRHLGNRVRDSADGFI